MTEPVTNSDSLHNETKSLHSALTAGCGVDLTDKERIGLIRRLIALKVSIPLFALLVTTIVAPQNTRVPTRNQNAILRTA